MQHAVPSVIILSLVMFLRMLGIFIVLPVAAVLAGKMSDNSIAVGLAVGGYGITQALLQIPVGMLADRFGRKRVLLAALLLFTAGSFVAASADAIGWLIVGRLLQGGGVVASVAAAWLADVTAAAHRTKAMAVFGGAIGLAFVLSLFVGPSLVGPLGLSGLFMLAGGFGVVAVVLLSPLPAPPVVAASAVALSALVKEPMLRHVALCGFVLHYAMAAMFVLLPSQLAASLPVTEHGAVYIGGFFAALLFAAPLLFIADKRPTLMTCTAVVLLAVGSVGFIFADRPLVAGVALFFFFAGFTPLEAALPAAATKIAPAAGRATAVAFVLGAEFVGVFVGGIFSSVVRQTGGQTAAVSLIVLLLVVWLWSEKRQFKRNSELARRHAALSDAPPA